MMRTAELGTQTDCKLEVQQILLTHNRFPMKTAGKIKLMSYGKRRDARFQNHIYTCFVVELLKPKQYSKNKGNNLLVHTKLMIQFQYKQPYD